MPDVPWDGRDISSQKKKKPYVYDDQAAWAKEVAERDADTKAHGGKTVGQQVNERLKKEGR